ncbi:hypothetical protein QL285_049374 [Trifolium repens]|nr:hypothetical protein QL285_049374 [Trifolium repens]
MDHFYVDVPWSFVLEYNYTTSRKKKENIEITTSRYAIKGLWITFLQQISSGKRSLDSFKDCVVLDDTKSSTSIQPNMTLVMTELA